MYSPTLGGFVQTDPIGYGDGMNWHNYVGGDPVNRADSMGLATTVKRIEPIPPFERSPFLEPVDYPDSIVTANKFSSWSSWATPTTGAGYEGVSQTTFDRERPTPPNGCPNKGLASLGNNISRFGDATATAGTILTATAIVADVLAAPTVVGEVPTLTATAVGLGVTAFGGGVSLLGKGVSYLGDRNLPRFLASSAGSLGDLLTRGSPVQKLFKQALLDKASDAAGNALSGGCK